MSFVSLFLQYCEIKWLILWNLVHFTCRRLILSSSSHSRPSSTSMAFLITVAISFIFSMCACISCNINTVNAYLSPSTRVNLSKSVCGTDISVLFSELGDYSGIIFLAGHQKAKHLLSVFAHDQLQRRLMLLQRRAQLCRETREDLDTTLQLSSCKPSKHTFVFMLQFPNLPVFLLDSHDQSRARPMSRHLVQHLDLILVLREQAIWGWDHETSFNSLGRLRASNDTCFMASTLLFSSVVCSIRISAALSWSRSLSTSDLASASTFSSVQVIPEEHKKHTWTD